MLRQRTVHGFWSRPLHLYARRSSAPALRAAFALPFTTGAHLQAAAKTKRTRTTVKLSDLPQGKIAASPLAPEEQNVPAYPTVILQARRHMDKFEKCVLLTRVGGFYELYFEHAEEYATHFGIRLAFKKTTAGPVPMVKSYPPLLLCIGPIILHT